MKKILLVCPSSPRNHAGGTVNMVLQIANKLKKNKIDVTILTTAKKPKKTKIHGIPIEEYPVIGSKKNYFLSPKLIKSIKKKEAKIIHCFGYNNLITLFTMINKPKLSKLIVTPASAGSSSLFRRALLLLHEKIFRFYSKNIDVAIFLSEFEKKLFLKKLKINPKSSYVIPVGVDKEKIRRIKIKKRHELISVGRLVKNKGFHRLLQIFKIITKKDENVKLRIVGTGPEKRKLEKMAKKLGIDKKVEFLGKIPFSRRNDLFRALKRAKAFVFLSNYESQGVVISEAIAAGIPVFVFDNSAQSEFINKKQAIRLEDNEPNESIAQKIVDTLKKPNLFIQKGEPLSIGQVVDKHCRIYERILR